MGRGRRLSRLLGPDGIHQFLEAARAQVVVFDPAIAAPVGIAAPGIALGVDQDAGVSLTLRTGGRPSHGFRFRLRSSSWSRTTRSSQAIRFDTYASLTITQSLRVAGSHRAVSTPGCSSACGPLQPSVLSVATIHHSPVLLSHCLFSDFV